MGIRCMGDVLSPNGDFLSWADLNPAGGDRLGERAFVALLSNLNPDPIVEAMAGVFFEGEGEAQLSHYIWQFDVPPGEILSSWWRLKGIYTPVKTFRIRGGVV